MLRILHDTKYDFIRLWRWAAGITLAFLLVGVAAYAVTGGPKYSIEFTGGTLMQVEFVQPPRVDDIRATLDEAGVHGAEIQQFGSNREFTIRAQGASESGGAETTGAAVKDALERRFGANNVTVLRTEAVGPRVGAELRRGALIAVLISFAVTLMYLAWRFEWRFGLAAVAATAHDLLATIAFIKLLDLEISLTVIAAILTVIGYSLNDTIIIFDRVRENLRKHRKEPLYDLLNRSINETLPRSVLTHATTLAATLALLFFAGEVIRPFAWVMSFGIFTGTFSSIYVASPLLLWIERRWPRAVSEKGGSGARIAPRDDRRPPRAERPGTTVASR
jgi:preprotein translocase subunit SecF